MGLRMQRAWVKTTAAPPHAIAAGMSIAWHINDLHPEDGAFPSMVELCEWVHKDVRNVRKDLKAIPELVTEGGRGRGKRYWLDINLDAIEADLKAEKKARRQKATPDAGVPKSDASDTDVPRTHTSVDRTHTSAQRTQASPVREVNGSEQTLAPSAGLGASGAQPALGTAGGDGEASSAASLPFTLAEICGKRLEEMTEAERGKLNKAAKQLSDIGATPAEVRERARRYRERHPSWTLTDMALVKHWSSLATKFSDLDPDQRDLFEAWFGDDKAELQVNRLSSAERDALEREIGEVLDWADDLETERRQRFDRLEEWLRDDLRAACGGFKSDAMRLLDERPEMVDTLTIWRDRWLALDEWVREAISEDGNLARLKFCALPDEERAAAVDELWAGVATAVEPWTSLSDDIRSVLGERWNIDAVSWLGMADYTRQMQLQAAEGFLPKQQSSTADLFEDQLL